VSLKPLLGSSADDYGRKKENESKRKQFSLKKAFICLLLFPSFSPAISPRSLDILFFFSLCGHNVGLNPRIENEAQQPMPDTIKKKEEQSRDRRFFAHFLSNSLS
jgi:hypothetical protein